LALKAGPVEVKSGHVYDGTILFVEIPFQEIFIYYIKIYLFIIMILVKSFILIFLMLVTAFLYRKNHPIEKIETSDTDKYNDYLIQEGFESAKAGASGAGASGAESSLSADPNKKKIINDLDKQLKEILVLKEQMNEINEGFMNNK
jgi:hypothetical protein